MGEGIIRKPITQLKTYNECLRYILDMAELMLASGGEIHRVEKTIRYMAKAYGATTVDVFVITTNIIVTALFENGIELTQHRQIPTGRKLDYTKVEALNRLSRECCKQPLPLEALENKIQEIDQMNDNMLIWYLASMLGAGAFAVFFGGSFWDGLVSAGFALFICFLQKKFAPVCPNNVIFYLITSLITGIGIGLVGKGVPMLHADMIMIGDIMLMIPGLGATNAVRDVLAGDTISGILRLIEALLWAAALAAGFMIALRLVGGL